MSVHPGAKFHNLDSSIERVFSSEKRKSEKNRIVSSAIASLQEMQFTKDDVYRFLRDIESQLQARHLVPHHGCDFDKVRKIFKKAIERLDLPLERLVLLSQRLKDPDLKKFLILQVHRRDPSRQIQDKYKKLCETILDKIRECMFISPNHLKRNVRLFENPTLQDEVMLHSIYTDIVDQIDLFHQATRPDPTDTQNYRPRLFHFDRVHYISQWMKPYQCAACFEIAAFTHIHLVHRLPHDVSTGILHITNGNHVVNVVAVDANCDVNDPETYGVSAYILGGWDDLTYPAIEAKDHLITTHPDNAFHVLSNGRLDYSKAITFPYDPKKHRIELPLTTIAFPETFRKATASFASDRHQRLLNMIEKKLFRFHSSEHLLEKLQIARSLLIDELDPTSCLIIEGFIVVDSLKRQLEYFIALWETPLSGCVSYI